MHRQQMLYREDVYKRQLECMTETEKRIMGENGRKAALNIFNYDKLAQKFLEVLELSLIHI